MGKRPTNKSWNPQITGPRAMVRERLPGFGPRDGWLELDTVYTSELDGFGFQDLCARIFKRLEWGDVQTYTTQDKGRDIGIDTPDGHIVIECKHQPGGTVGRPIIQKLHSATIWFHGTKGVVVTTGKFSDEAVEHARELSKSIPIELVDWHELRKLAHGAGINIYESADKMVPVIYGYQVDHAAMQRRVTESFETYRSSPNRTADLVKIKALSWNAEPAYRVKYDIEEKFETTTYLLKDLKEHGQIIMIDGAGKRMRDSAKYDFVNAAPLVDFDEIVSGKDFLRGTDSLLDHFSISRQELVRIAEDMVIDTYTETIRYKGKNNVRYEKLCVPGRKSVRIADIKQVVIADYDVKIGILDREITRRVMDNTKSTMFIDSGIKCVDCSRGIEGGAGQVCNTCGNLTHARRMFWSCGFECKECKRTICPICTKSSRRMLFFKRRLCGQCSAARAPGT